MYELEAMALPQPNVLNLTSLMMPLSSTRICSFMTSPQLVDRNSGQDWEEKVKENTGLTQVLQPIQCQHQCHLSEESLPGMARIMSRLEKQRNEWKH